jgi:hypothetical protein
LSSICSSFSRSPCIILLTGMPVARETTSAISSAPTWCAAACSSPPSCRPTLASAGLQLRLQLGQLAVLQLGHLVELSPLR